MTGRFAARPLPTRDEALAYAKEMVQKEKWDTIAIVEGSTEDGGDGLLLRPAEACWIISYDAAPMGETGEEKVWVEKSSGVVVKMVLED
jgi:hypothetical protein